jgi:hypothetical protein
MGPPTRLNKTTVMKLTLPQTHHHMGTTLTMLIRRRNNISMMMQPRFMPILHQPTINPLLYSRMRPLHTKLAEIKHTF